MDDHLADGRRAPSSAGDVSTGCAAVPASGTGASVASAPWPRCGRGWPRRRRRGGRRRRTRTVGVGGLDAPAADVPGARSANGHCRSRWKMWPPGIASAASISRGPITSMQSRVEQAVLDRLVQHAVERAPRSRLAVGQRAGRVVAEQPGRHVQAEQRQRLRPGRPQVRAEDRRVGQRVAVDLARRQVGHGPGRGLAVGALQLLVALVDVERAGERLLGRHRRDRAAGQPRQQHVDLDLGALRAGAARRAPRAVGRSTVGATLAQHLAGAERAAVGRGDPSPLTVRRTATTSTPVSTLGTRVGGGGASWP